MKEKNKEYPFYAAFGVLLAYFSYRMVLVSLPDHLSDFNGHVYVYLTNYLRKETVLRGLGEAPYCLWHLLTIFGYKVLGIPLDHSAAYVNSLFALFSYGVFCFFLRKISDRTERPMGDPAVAMISFGLCILQPLTAEWMKVTGIGLAAFGLNPLHNPSYLAVRPFSVLCFCLVVDIWGKQKDDRYRGIFFKTETGLKKYYIALAVVLLLSVFAKPTFAEMFIPAVGLMMLFSWGISAFRKDGSGKKAFADLLSMFYCAIPSVLFILLQFYFHYLLGGQAADTGSSVVITPYLYVWRGLTENVGMSLILSMAFPMFMFLVDSRNILRSPMGKLAVVSASVSFLEAAFLGENAKMEHGNFLWPMMSGMLFLYLAALADLAALENMEEDTLRKRVPVLMSWSIYGLQVLCGVLYILNMIKM